MEMVVPTLLLLLLTALIGWGLFVLIQKLDRMGGEGHGVRGRVQVEAPEQKRSSE